MKTAITRDAHPTAGARDKKPWDKVLTPRQARFVEEYLKDLNGTERDAGRDPCRLQREDGERAGSPDLSKT